MLKNIFYVTIEMQFLRCMLQVVCVSHFCNLLLKSLDTYYCVILWNVWSQKGFDFANRGVRRSERLVSDPGYGWAISSLSPSTDAVAAGAAGRH